MTEQVWWIVRISLVAAAILTAFFMILLLRRWRLERTEKAMQATLAAITRSYLQRVGGFAGEASHEYWPNELRMAAVSHLHMLLRGGERDRLMQMAEHDGLLCKTLRQSHHWITERRIDAIRTLQQFGSNACIARLHEILARDRHATVRLEAAFALASLKALPPPRELIRLLGMLERKPNRLDAALLRSTAEHYADHLLWLLGEPLPEASRALIIDALGWSDNLGVLPTLERAASSASSELRSAALRAAARLGHPACALWVLRLLSDPIPFVRIQAVNCCAALQLYNAVPQLNRMLDDEDLWVRVRAEEALEKLAGFGAFRRSSEAAA